MRGFRWIVAGFGALFIIGAGPVQAQFQAEKYTLTVEERQQLTQGRDHLKLRIKELRPHVRQNGRDPWLGPDLLADVEVFCDAVDRNLEQNLFFTKGNVAQALACLKEGEARADALQSGNSPWTKQTGVVILGYRSEVDNSVQPYQVYIPAGYDFTASTSTPQTRCVWISFLHGRGGNLQRDRLFSARYGLGEGQLRYGAADRIRALLPVRCAATTAGVMRASVTCSRR